MAETTAVRGFPTALGAGTREPIEQKTDWMGNGLPSADAADNEYRQQKERERVRRRIRRELDDEDRADRAPVLELPPRRTLRTFLAETIDPAPWRIENLLTCGGNVLLNAKLKAGKTTLIANLLRSLADGDRFLDRFAIRPPGGTIALMDFELPEGTLRDWLRMQNLRDLDAVEPYVLKGRAASFDVRRDDVRARWAERLAGTDVLVLDTLSPLLTALGIKEATEAGDLLPAFDALKVEAGISDLIVVHHQGHVAERARGDSRLGGWADSIWSYNLREGDSTRYLSVQGRDTFLPETAVDFDPSTKRLTMAAGSRRDAAVDDALDEVVKVLDLAGEPLSGAKIEASMADSELPRSACRDALMRGVASGALVFERGQRGAKLYRRVGS